MPTRLSRGLVSLWRDLAKELPPEHWNECGTQRMVIDLTNEIEALQGDLADLPSENKRLGEKAYEQATRADAQEQEARALRSTLEAVKAVVADQRKLQKSDRWHPCGVCMGHSPSWDGHHPKCDSATAFRLRLEKALQE